MKICRCHAALIQQFLTLCYYYCCYFLDPGTQFPGNEKITLCNTKKVQKSNWNEPYSSCPFTKQSCSKMALYRWINYYNYNYCYYTRSSIVWVTVNWNITSVRSFSACWRPLTRVGLTDSSCHQFVVACIDPLQLLVDNHVDQDEAVVACSKCKLTSRHGAKLAGYVI